MGADLIGYFLYVPKDNTIRNKVFKEHAQKLNNIINSSIAFITDQDQEDVWKSLSLLGVDSNHFKEFANDAEEAIETISDCLVEIEQGFEWPSPARDLVEGNIIVNGMQVEVCFAGEMSWGDSPEGSGYKLLESLNNLGFYDAFFKAIPWGNK